MQIKTKLIFIFVFIFIIFVMFLIYYDIFHRKEYAMYQANNFKQRNIVLHSFFDNRKNSMLRTADDYSLWDEMVDFIDKNDIAWAEEYVKPILSIHSNDFVWVFNKKQQLIFFSSGMDIKPIIISEEVFQNVKKNGLSHFFKKFENTVMEIAAATIHPTKDDERLTEPEGFFIFAKLYSSSFLSQLENQTGYMISINPSPKEGVTNLPKTSSFIAFDKILYDEQNKPIMTLQFSQSDPFMKTIKTMHRKAITVLSVFTFLFLIGLYLLFHFWIRKPLILISESLRTNEMDKIKRISTIENEFGKISKLIIHYFEQSQLLQKEMKDKLAAKQELIDTTDRFYKIFEHSPDLILITKDSILLEANKTFWKETGYFENQLIGKKINETNLFPENFTENELMGNSILQILTSKGNKIDVLLSIEEIDFEQKKCHLYMMRNITEELKMEKQLIQSQKMDAISSLAAGIAHDFNNILNVIMGYTETIKVNSLINTEQHEKLILIENASQRAKDLVKQIVLISRQHEPSQQVVKPKVIIQQAVKFLKPSIPSSIEINTMLQSDSTILADPMQMHQLMINLCTNSFQAIAPNNGTIEIRLFDEEKESSNSKDKKQLCITVHDTGCGIAPNILDKIFDPYFSTKNEQQGFGLGLAIVQGIVESCNGTIEVESNLHRGTTFTLHFPVHETEHKISSQDIVSNPLKNKTVLFVEDEKELLALFQETLLDAEFDVISTDNGRKALEFFMAQQQSIDIVVTDSAMSGLSGIELIRIIRNYNQKIPIILYSGFKTKEMEAAMKDLNISAFLLKPIIPQEMVHTINEVINNEEKSGT